MPGLDGVFFGVKFSALARLGGRHFNSPMETLMAAEKSPLNSARSFAMVAILVLTLAAGLFAGGKSNNQSSPNPTGEARTFTKDGFINLDSAFFKSLGTNGRSCASC